MTDAPRDPPIVDPPIRLAVCVSGGGTTLQNLHRPDPIASAPPQIVQVVASRPRIGAIPRAEAAGIPLALASRNAKSRTEFSTSVFDPIRHSKADLVVLGGFLSLLYIPPDYKGRVLNVHPSLIPAFSGKGYYRLAGPQGRARYGVKVSGCTVHFADDDLRHWPDHPPTGRAGPGRRHPRSAGRPGLPGGMRGPPRGHRPLRRGTPPARRPSRPHRPARLINAPSPCEPEYRGRSWSSGAPRREPWACGRSGSRGSD